MACFTAPQELHDLAFRYGHAVDTRDAEELGSLFTADGRIGSYPDGIVRYCGTAGWAQMIAEVAASFGETMHNVFNQTFEQDAHGTVRGLTTGIASHLVGEEESDLAVLDFAMRYHNRYAMEQGLWKFAERRLEVVWVERRPVRRFSPAMLGRELAGFR